MEINPEEYELKGPDANAKGLFKVDSFVVKAGSLARRDPAPASKRITPIHQRLLREGVLEEFGKSYRFAKDHGFDSPSGAAQAVLARDANGWIEWKRADGKSLSEIKRGFQGIQPIINQENKLTEIKERYEQLLSKGELTTPQQLDKWYALFRERFGPSVLSSLEGESLLNLMHDSSNRDSLVYWLEFKNDEEFDKSDFGSISGGSALKFRIFRRSETGIWQKKAENRNVPQDISTAEAIGIATSHRDQFIAGAKILEGLSVGASDDDYALLQQKMDELAPDVSRLAFGHKYFSMLFPDKLDNYHRSHFQSYQLIKMLQMPPSGSGHYVCGGRFVSIADQLGIRLDHLTETLNTLHGRPHSYWRIGTTSGETGVSFWEMMRNSNCIAVGWPKLGDIAWVSTKNDSIDQLKARMVESYPNDPRAIGRDCSQLAQFVTTISEGDIVLAANGMTILGIGKILGGYEFNPESEFPHQRPVEWLNLEEWKMPESNEGLQSTVRELGKFNVNLLAIEQRIQSPSEPKHENGEGKIKAKRPVRLMGISGRIQSVLERKSQVILYGPPGTGKTYWADRTANDLAALSTFGKLFEELDEAERTVVTGHGDNAGLVRLCCFHPAYGYEDFLEGYRPKTVNEQVAFELRDGIFKRLCKDADASPERSFYLVIDEINRGDIPRIFGELLTALEKDKRGKRIILPVSQEIFSVPRNVFLIGTMNTADRSISLLDAALRRRFGFVELMPDSNVLKDSAVAGIPLKAWLDALNKKIREHVGRDARNLQIGHSYLMHGGNPLKDIATLKRAIRDDIIPLLEEYCYEDYGTLGNILGHQIVDVAATRVRHELFDDGQEMALTDGLLAPFADISTSTEAILTEGCQDEAVEDDDGDGA